MSERNRARLAKPLCDEDQRRRFVGFGMKRLSDFDELERHASDQLHPALDRSKIPGRGISKILVEACPRSFAPAVDVWLVSVGNYGMQRLNHQRPTGVDQSRRAPDHSLDRFLSDQRKIRYCDIYADVEVARCDLLVRGDAKLTASSLLGLFDQRGDDID